MNKNFLACLEKALNGEKLERQDIVTLLSADSGETEILCNAADRVRAQAVGEEVHLRGLIEFSNYCRQNCLYCGLRRGNKGLARYRMEPEEIVAVAEQAARIGFKTIVLQSGEDTWYTAELLASIVQEIKSRADVAVTLSLGDRSEEDYLVMREAGADRYLLKHETADPVLFARLRPGTSLACRLQSLRTLKKLGYQVGSGNMVGLPGQTVETLAEDILLLRDVKVDMAGIGPFIPHPGTPLGHEKGGTIEDAIKVLAVTRLVLPFCLLPATTAVGSIGPGGREKALRSGANVVMPDVTPQKYRKLYQIYPGRVSLGEELEEVWTNAVSLVEKVGRKVGRGYGHAMREQALSPAG